MIAWLREWFPIDHQDLRSPARQVAEHVGSIIWLGPMLAAMSGRLGR